MVGVGEFEKLHDSPLHGGVVVLWKSVLLGPVELEALVGLDGDDGA